MQRKAISLTNVLGVVLGGFVGLAFGKWMATKEEEAEKKLELEQIRQQANASKLNSLRFPIGKFWNREQILYSLFFPLLKYSLDSEAQVYPVSSLLSETDQNDLDDLTARRINDEFYIIGWNLESGTFEFRRVFDANATIFEGRIISINSRSLRVTYYSFTKELDKKWKVIEVYFDKYRTNHSLERLQNFERKLPTGTSHFALSELFDPAKVDSRQFDEMLGTDLVSSISQAAVDFDRHTPLPIVLRQLTFEYAS